MRRRMGSRGAVSLGLAVALLAGLVPIVVGTGNPASVVQLLDRSVWLASWAEGHVVRVSGETARVDARIGLGDPGTDVVVDQDGSTVLVDSGDLLRRVDIANLDWAASATKDPGALLVAGERGAYLVEAGGRVRVLDPASLDPRADVDLGGRAGSAVVDPRGDLYVALDDGEVVRLTGQGERSSTTVGRSGAVIHLAVVGERAVALNATRGEVVVLRPDGASSPVALSRALPSTDLRLAERAPAGRLWATSPATGHLLGIDVRTGDVRLVEVGRPGSDLLAPAVTDDRVHVLDRTASRLVVHDLSGRAIDRQRIEVDDPSRLELVARGGVVVVNDPLSSYALVVDGDEITVLDKYTEDGVAVVTPDDPAPDLPDPAPVTPPSPSPSPPSVPQPEPGTGPATPPTTGPGGGSAGTPPPAAVPTTPVTTGPPAPDARAPSPPTSVDATPGDRSATITWAAPDDDGGAHVTGYRITWPDATRPITVPAADRRLTVDGLVNGNTYAFEVRAVNQVGESRAARTPSVRPNAQVPGAPSGAVAQVQPGRTTVTWEPADARGNRITGYRVETLPSGPVVEVGGGTTSTTVDGLTHGDEVRFAVVAVNDLGSESTPSEPSNRVVPYDRPGEIGTTSVSEQDRALHLSWQPAPDNGRPVTYRASISPRPGSGDHIVETAETEARFTGLTNGTIYTVTIVAVNEGGDGPPASVTGSPGAAPRITQAPSTSTAPPSQNGRRVTFSFSIDPGGRPTTCRLFVEEGEWFRQDWYDIPCDGGTLELRTHWTVHGGRLHVTNERGEAVSEWFRFSTDSKQVAVTGGALVYDTADDETTARPIGSSVTDVACVVWPYTYANTEWSETYFYSTSHSGWVRLSHVVTARPEDNLAECPNVGWWP